MVYLGFVTGARPSTLSPLRRSGPERDVLWEEGVILLRRSNALGKEIMDADQTKTALDRRSRCRRKRSACFASMWRRYRPDRCRTRCSCSRRRPAACVRDPPWISPSRTP
jgi:hypothetical protein